MPGPHGRDALAFAPPCTGLAHAAEEARLVERGLRRSLDVTALTGDAATERALKDRAPGASLLHLATHGRFDHVNPLFSSVVLEPGGGEDGMLHAYQLLDLDLRVDLVTLRACDTGLGSGPFADAPDGDDLMGLSRAFLQAGTPSVLSALWPVDDRATSDLMRRFYRHLGDGNNASALARAQRDLLRAGGEAGLPARDRAGFVLFGDGR